MCDDAPSKQRRAALLGRDSDRHRKLRAGAE